MSGRLIDFTWKSFGKLKREKLNLTLSMMGVYVGIKQFELSSVQLANVSPARICFPCHAMTSGIVDLFRSTHVLPKNV